MNPIRLEIFLDDKTLAGMRSVEGNVDLMETYLKTTIARLEKELADMQAAAKKAMSQGISDPKELADVQALQGAVGQLKEGLKELEEQKRKTNGTPMMGEDPAPKLNSVKFSMQQIARELPSLAMGPQMFFLAISNNIPMFTDAVGNARKEYERLTAAGQKATPIWKQLLVSLFSWQTAMAVAITLTVVYGREIGEWIKGLFKAKDAILGLLSAEQEMALARSKASDSIKKERAELDILYSKLKDTSLSTKERTASVNEWVKRYPEYANILSGEHLNLSKLETAYRALSKEIYANAVARNYVDKVADLSVKREKEEIKRLNQKATLMKAQKAYDLAMEVFNNSTGQSKNAAAINVGRAEKELQKQQKIYDDIVRTLKVYDDNVTTISNHIKTNDLFPQPNEGTYNYWTQQKERAEGVLKEIKSDIKKTLDDASKEGKDLFSLGIDKSVVETYKQATDDLKKAKKELDIYDFKDKKQTGKSQTEYQNELDDARIRAQQKVEAARIAVMVEGTEKRKALANKEYKETLAAIDKEERDTLTKLEKSKKAGKKVTSEEKQQVKDDASSQRKYAQLKYMQDIYTIEKEWREKSQQAWIDYNKEYGSHEQKRLAITQDYAIKIAKASTGGEKASLKRKREDDLKELDFSEFKKSINFADVFGDLDEQSTDALSVLRDKLKEYINGAAKKLRPSDLKELQDAFSKIELKLTERSPFRQLKQSMKDYEIACKEVDEAQNTLSLAQKEGYAITEKLDEKTGKIVYTYLTLEQAEKNLNEAQQKRWKNQTKLAQSLFSAADEMAAYGQAADDVVNMLEGFGVSVDENVKRALEGFNAMSDGIKQFAQSLMSGDIAGMISGVVNTVGGFINTIGSVFGADWGGERSERRYQQAKEKYESYIEVLDKVISKQKELVASMEADDFANADNSYEKARELLKKQQEYAREMGKAYLNAGASKGFLGMGSSASHGVDQRKDISASAWEQAKKALGSDFDKYDIGSGRMTGLFDLTYEQLVKLRDEATGFWSELHEDTQTYLEQIIESEEAWQEVQNTRKEALTKTDFDSFYNGFISMLSDMDATSEDFADSFEKYLQNAIFSALVATQYKDKIQKLYDSWANLAGEDGLSSVDAEKLRGDYQDIVDEMLKEREQLMKDFGWTSSADASSQSGRSGAFTTLTQEQGTKLEGLFTSVQDHLSGMHQLLDDLIQGRIADREIFMQIAENTAYCRLLEDILDILERQDRDGMKLKD